MSNKITVKRFLRDTSSWNDNLYAITFLFDIDYDTRKVSAKWSICNGDNFDKKIGVKIASEKKHSFEFDLDSFQETKEGLVQYLVQSVMLSLDKDPYEFTYTHLGNGGVMRCWEWAYIAKDLNAWTRKQSTK